MWSGSPWQDNRVTLLDGVYSGAFILTFWAFADLPLPFANSLASIGSKSFGIYLVHGVAMEYLARGLYHLAPWILGQQGLLQPMLIATGLAAPLLLMRVVNRSRFRWAYSYVFG